MKTLELQFDIQNQPTTVVIDFSDDAEQPIAAIRLAHGDFRAVGMANVRECLGDSLDSLLAHALECTRQRTSLNQIHGVKGRYNF